MTTTVREDEPLKLAVIVGSVRDGRFAPQVVDWFVERAQKQDRLRVDLIDLIDFTLPNVMPDFGRKPEAAVQAELDRLTPRLAAAEAFVVVTPEYNHSFPASLKNAIDWHRQEWRAKPVGFVSYGGMSGGLRAVEHLRAVFAECHSVTVRDSVSLHSQWDLFASTGGPPPGGEIDMAARALLEQMWWWGLTCRDGRARTPYQA